MTQPNLSDTMVERAVEKIQQRSPAGRYVENGLAVVGIAQAALYGTLEALASVGWRLGECTAATGIPWVTLVIFVGCVLPKTVGRATAGRVWEAFSRAKGGSAP